MNYRFISENLQRNRLIKISFFLIVLCLAQNHLFAQETSPASVSFSRTWFDKNGRNTLTVNGQCLCNPIPEYGVREGSPSKIEVELSNDKHKVSLIDSLTFDEYQIKTMHVRESEVWTAPFRGTEIVFIPVFYCQNYDMETYLSYIILYGDQNWSVDVRYMYDIEGDGAFYLNDDLCVKLKSIHPRELRRLITEQIQRKYTTIKEYEDIFIAIDLQ